MSDPLQTVRDIYAAFGRGDIPAILDCLADDVRWEEWADNSAQRAGVPWLQARQGKASALEFFQALSAAHFHDFRVLALMAGDHQVAAEVAVEFEVLATGRRCCDEEIHLWTFDDNGQVIRLRHYADTAKHIAAAQH